MQKRASFLSWRQTADFILKAALKIKFHKAGPTNGAGPKRDIGQEVVLGRSNCLRGAGGRVTDHAEHGLAEQQAATEVGRGNRHRSPRETFVGKLFDKTKQQFNLFRAWRRIRENGYASSHEESRWAIEQFDRQANRNIIKLQRRLSSGQFQFDPQTGVAKKKSNGNGKRGIVMASVHNRVVERALLDTLQSDCQLVKDVITTPTSVGGVPERSVPHGLHLIDKAFQDDCLFFVRSDISGFFDGIPRKAVIEKLACEIDDEKFLSLLDEATTVTLANEKALGEDRAIFPTDDEGVAQGSPLSPLFGNVLLHEFDKQFNRDKVVCIRFIDDFILLSPDEKRVKKAFASAKTHLEELGLKCHDPFNSTNVDKAQWGKVTSSFTFLGYQIEPGLIQPSAKARTNILNVVRQRIKTGKRHITAIGTNPDSDNSQRYAQTLVGIDRALRGWGNAFAYGNVFETIEQLDQKIDVELSKFRNWYSSYIRERDWKFRRRTGGVGLLSDIRSKSIHDLPFKIVPGGRFVQSRKTVTISTDGSVLGSRRHSKDVGPGGWAYLVHETGHEASGSCADVTNNQMELRAVIEALKAIPLDKSICIRTDSQYVQQIASGQNVLKSNSDMWREYQELTQDRRLKIVWIRGHDGDPHNERVDTLAKKRATEISAGSRAA